MPEAQSRDTATAANPQSATDRFETVAKPALVTRRGFQSPLWNTARSVTQWFLPTVLVPTVLVPTVILCGFGFCGVIAKDAPPTVAPAIRQVDAATRRVEIHDTDTLLLEYPDWLTTVKSLDPAVIHVSAVRPNCLRVQRVSQGKATLHAVDRGDRRYSIEVIVRAQVESQK